MTLNKIRTYGLLLLCCTVFNVYANKVTDKRLGGTDCSDAQMTINSVNTDSTMHCVSDSLTFKDVSDADPNSTGQSVTWYLYHFGDGVADSFTTPGYTTKHKYAAAGTYTTQLVTYNSAPVDCYDTMTLVVRVFPEIVLDLDSVDEVCASDANGQALFNITAGTSPYDMLWSATNDTADTIVFRTDTASNRDTIKSLVPGDYFISLLDSSGKCSLQDSIAINTGKTLSITTAEATAISCNNGNNGAVQVTVNNGVANYAYDWGGTRLGSDSSSTTNVVSNVSTLSNVIAGEYYIKVTDGVGCEQDDSITIVEPSAIVSFDSVVTPVPCYGDSGAVRIRLDAAGGGVANFQYEWSDTLNDATPTRDQTHANRADTLLNVPAGEYYVTITDGNGCTHLDSVTLNPVAQIVTIDSVVSPIACGGGATGGARVRIASGGFSNFQYEWSTSATGIPLLRDTTRAQVSDSLINVAADEYYVTITDANGCTTNDSVTIADGVDLTSTHDTVTNIFCTDSLGSFAISVTGGNGPFDYAWSSVALGNNELRDTLNKVAAIDTILNVAAGKYYVSVTDNNGCFVTDSMTFDVGYTIDKDATIDVTLDCYGDTDGAVKVDMLANGVANYTYDWSLSLDFSAPVRSVTKASTSDTYTGVGSDKYYVKISDANGCTIVDSVNLTQPDTLIVTATADSALCGNVDDATALATISGGVADYFFVWSTSFNSGNDGSVSQSALTFAHTDLTGGKYHIRVSDANFCVAFDSITVFQNEPMVISETVTNATCNQSDGKIIATVDGGAGDSLNFIFAWPDSVATVGLDSLVQAPAGTYALTVTDSVGCTVNKSLTISNDNAPTIDDTTITDITCFGGADGEIVADPSSGGVGTRVFSIDGGAYATDSAFTGLSAGPHIVTVRDDNLCQSSVSVTLTEPDEIDITFVADRATCGNTDGIATATIVTGGTGPYNYEWNSNVVLTDTFINGLDTGWHVLSIIDALACPAYLDSVHVDLDTTWITLPSDVTEITGDTSLCVNIATTFQVDNVAGVTSYEWLDDPVGLDLASANGTVSMDYTVSQYSFGDSIKIAFENACSAYDTITKRITTVAAFDIVFDDTLASCNTSDGELFVTNASSGGYGGYAEFSYNWGPGETSSSLDSLGEGIYTVTITDTGGCVTIASGVVEADSAYLSARDSLSFPNGFTFQGDVCPNGTYNYRIDSINIVDSYIWSFISPTGSATFDSAQGDTAMTITYGADFETALIQINFANNCGAKDSAYVGQVNVLDSIDFSLAADSSNCADNNGRAYVASATGGMPDGDYIYSWNESGDPTVLGTNQQLLTVTSGVYVVTINDTTGCYNQKDSIEIFEDDSLYLSSLSSIQFASGDDSVCIGESANYWVDSIPLVSSYVWSSATGNLIDGGTDTSRVCSWPAHSMSDLLQVVITNQCGSSQTLDTLIYVDTPANVISLDLPTSVLCLGGSLPTSTLTATPIHPNVASYLWSSDDPGIQFFTNTDNPTVIDFSGASGVANISVYVTTKYCALVDTFTEVALLAATPDASFTVDPIICVTSIGDGSVLPVKTDNSTTGTWIWSNGATNVTINPTSGEIGVAPLPLTSVATFSMGYSVTSGSGCTDYTTEVVSIVPQDDASFEYVKVSDRCENGDVYAILSSYLPNGTFWFAPAAIESNKVDTWVIDGAGINQSTGLLTNTTGGSSYEILYQTPIGPLQTTVPYGCVNYSVDTIDIATSTDASLWDYVAPLCAADSIELIYTGDVSTLATLTWQINNDIISLNSGFDSFKFPTNSVSNTILITTIDESGCESYSEIPTITLPTDLKVSIADSVNGCRGDTTWFSSIDFGYDIDRLVWEFGDSTDSINTSGSMTTLVEHVYYSHNAKTVSLTVEAGLCSGIAELELTTHEVIIDTIDTIEVPFGSSVTLATELIYPEVLNDFDHEWISLNSASNDLYLNGGGNQVNPVCEPQEDIDYMVIVTDPSTGCKDTTTFHVFVETTKRFWIPTTFSPNGDDRNDVFRFFGVGICGDMTMKIFNRWGERVKVLENEGWDGKNEKGVDQPIDTYVYILEFEYCDGTIEKEPIRGTITLIR